MLRVSVAICQCVKGKIGSLLAGKKVVVENRLFLLYFIFLIEGWSGPLLIGVLAVPCHEAPARGPLGAGMQPEPIAKQCIHPGTPFLTVSPFVKPCLLRQQPAKKITIS